MNETLQQQLIDEVRKLRESAEALTDHVEDVAASIRYLTNNLLDDQYHPDMADGVRQLAEQVHQLISSAPTPLPDKNGLPQFANQAKAVSLRCSSLDMEHVSNGESADVRNGSGEKEEGAKSNGDATGVSHGLPSNDATQSNGTLPVDNVEVSSEEAGGVSRGVENTDWQPPLWSDEATELEGNELVIVENGDGDVAIYTSDGEYLATEPTREAAFRTAELRQIEGRYLPNDSEFGDEELPELPIDTELPEIEHEPVLTESQESQAGDMDSFDSDHRPYTFDDLQSFQERFENQQVTASELKSDFRRLLDSRELLLETLIQGNNAKQLKAMATRSGNCSAGRQTKAENAASVFRSMTVWFNLHRSVRFSPFDGETYEDALAKMIDAINDEDLQDFYTQNGERQAAHEKAIENPETLIEYRTFVREVGEDALSDEQHIHRDQLYADMSRQTRIEHKSNSVQQFQSDQLDDLEFVIKEGYHEKRDCPLWIAQLSSRVDRSSYGELKAKAKQLGGWYSSFKKEDAGFQFLSEEAAHKFIGLREGDADRREELEDNRIRKIAGAGQRFMAMADRLTEQAEATLEADDDKLKNTHRRAEQAASTRAGAREALATSKTLRSLASRLSEGEVTYLDGIRYAVQIETLRSILRRARHAHIRDVMMNEHGDLSIYERSTKQDALEQRTADSSDIRFAEYPWPSMYRGHLERAFEQLGDTKGVKQITTKMRKLIGTASKAKDTITFSNDHAIEMLEDFLGRAKAAGYTCYWFDHCLDDHKRLRSANIHDHHELRAALAELLPHVNDAEGDDPVTIAVDELRGKKLLGFFPTPRPIILQMLDIADIQGDDRVLEPSAGMGNILDAVREQYPTVDLKSVEQNRTLAGVLAAKGYTELTTFGDFLKHQGPYDKIVMNPPFEQGADIDHVRHAYELLSVGGRVVSVMCEGPFFRSDTKSQEFRQWIEELDAQVEQLPDDAFQGIQAFRQTGVRARLVVLDKTG